MSEAQKETFLLQQFQMALLPRFGRCHERIPVGGNQGGRWGSDVFEEAGSGALGVSSFVPSSFDAFANGPGGESRQVEGGESHGETPFAVTGVMFGAPLASRIARPIALTLSPQKLARVAGTANSRPARMPRPCGASSEPLQSTRRAGKDPRSREAAPFAATARRLASPASTSSWRVPCPRLLPSQPASQSDPYSSRSRSRPTPRRSIGSAQCLWSAHPQATKRTMGD